MPEGWNGAAPTDTKAQPDPKRDKQDVDAGERHSGETLSLHALRRQSPHLTGYLCCFPSTQPWHKKQLYPPTSPA